jgi:hypothetical protein
MSNHSTSSSNSIFGLINHGIWCVLRIGYDHGLLRCNGKNRDGEQTGQEVGEEEELHVERGMRGESRSGTARRECVVFPIDRKLALLERVCLNRGNKLSYCVNDIEQVVIVARRKVSGVMNAVISGTSGGGSAPTAC